MKFFQRCASGCHWLHRYLYLFGGIELFEALLSRWEADLFLRSSFASLASFCLWAKILAYSAVAWRFFSARLRLSARRCLLRCNMIGVTRRWTFGAAYFCFLPSLRGRGRLMTYWHTLSSFDKLKSFLKYKNKCFYNFLKFFKVILQHRYLLRFMKITLF